MKLYSKILFCVDRETYDLLHAAKARSGRTISAMLREAVKTILQTD